MRRWIRAKGKVELVGALAQMVEHDSRLYPGVPIPRVDLDDLVEIFGEIDDHRNVAGLPRQAGAAAARQDRRAVLPGQCHGLNNVIDRAWDNNTDGRLSIVRAIHGVECAIAIIKAHLAADRRTELFG